MGFKTKVQVIQRRESQQWYINFPSACAQVMNFRKGEVVYERRCEIGVKVPV